MSTKTLNKWLNVINNNTELSESEIKGLKRQINGSSTLTDDERNILTNAVMDRLQDSEIDISQELSNKGIEYLRSKVFKINGSIRDTKEIRRFIDDDITIEELTIALKTFDRFTLVSFKNISENYYVNHIPVYRLYCKHGYFDYLGVTLSESMVINNCITLPTYSIIRHFKDHENEIIETGLTLEEAKEWCNDPETSSNTCSDNSLFELKGRWFDGYIEE